MIGDKIMTRQEIKNVRRTLRKFPEQYKFLNELHPEAFIVHNVTKNVTSKVVQRNYGFEISLIFKKNKNQTGFENVGTITAENLDGGNSHTLVINIEHDFKWASCNGKIAIIRYGNI